MLALHSHVVEALEQSIEQVHLLPLIDFIRMEQLFIEHDGLLYVPVQLLNQHKVLSHVLQEVVVEELEADSGNFGRWIPEKL